MSEERRGSPRVSHPFEARYYPFNELAIGWRPVQVVNISIGGIRFLGREPLAADQELELDVPLPGTLRPIRLRGRVVWTRMPAAGLSESGVAFSDLSLEQMLKIEEFVQFLTHRALRA